jgi:orotate phosphoribosyltransferase
MSAGTRRPVRRRSLASFVSYGDDPAAGGGRLVGERLPPGTPVHLLDDLVFSGRTLRSAREALSSVGLDARTASANLWTYRADAAMEELSAAGMTEITCLTHQSLIPG